MTTQTFSAETIEYIKQQIVKDGCRQIEDEKFQATNFGAVCTAEFYGCQVAGQRICPPCGINY